MQYGGAEGPASSWALELVSAFWETGTSAEGRCAGVDSHGAPQMNICEAHRKKKICKSSGGRAKFIGGYPLKSCRGRQLPPFRLDGMPQIKGIENNWHIIRPKIRGIIDAK